MIVQVTGPNWCAGLIAENGRVTDAPKLRWAIGKDTVWLSRYFERKGWKAVIVNLGKKNPAVCLDTSAGPPVQLNDISDSSWRPMCPDGLAVSPKKTAMTAGGTLPSWTSDPSNGPVA